MVQPADDVYEAFFNPSTASYSGDITIVSDSSDEPTEHFKIEFSIPDDDEDCYECSEIGTDVPTARVANAPLFPIVLVNADPVIISIPGNLVGLRWTDASRNLVRLARARVCVCVCVV